MHALKTFASWLSVRRPRRHRAGRTRTVVQAFISSAFSAKQIYLIYDTHLSKSYSHTHESHCHTHSSDLARLRGPLVVHGAVASATPPGVCAQSESPLIIHVRMCTTSTTRVELESHLWCGLE